jgi:hypothetical protein
MSGGASKEETEFLQSLRFRQKRPTALYYYRELQSLRDPLHFAEGRDAAMHMRGDAGEVQKLRQLESRKSAIRRWAKHRKNSGKTGKAKVT